MEILRPGRSRRCVAGLALGAALVFSATGSAQSPATQEITRSVVRALERLPYYGVFDFMAVGVDRGTVTLAGYAYHGSLRPAAEAAAKKAAGAVDVANKLEVLPASLEDDRIRWATFYRIYTDDFLSRYAPGGPFAVRREIADARRFPGMQPFGGYAIHIIVKNGRTTLLGVVDNEADRQIAEVRAREVGGVFGVANELTIHKP
jgi:osmotically-inducible protein OsmY